MNIEKSYWNSNADRVQLSVPFTKVDKANRTVSGFASVDNLDRHDDIIPADTAMKAFNDFRGNLREMHQPIAVGKVLSFEQAPVYDAVTEQNYNGVYVTAYISKGASDTWEKIIDGTLTGFSIGGGIKDSESKFDVASKKMTRVIKDMDLFELSVVDNPANPLANFVSVVKLYDGDVTKTADGIATDIKIDNIFWCGTDQYAKTTSDESATCFTCGVAMENIGWVESGDTEKVAAVVQNYVNNLSEGGLDMSENDTTAVVDEATGAEVVDKAVDGAGEPTELQKAVEELKSFVTKSINDATTSLEDKVNSRFEEVQKAWGTEVSERLESFTAAFNAAKEGASAVEGGESVPRKPSLTVGAEVEFDGGASDPTTGADTTVPAHPAFNVGPEVDLAKALDTLNEKVEALVQATAVKKSGDLGGLPVSSEKNSPWDGAFLNSASIVE